MILCCAFIVCESCISKNDLIHFLTNLPKYKTEWAKGTFSSLFSSFVSLVPGTDVFSQKGAQKKSMLLCR